MILPTRDAVKKLIAISTDGTVILMFTKNTFEYRINIGL